MKRAIFGLGLVLCSLPRVAAGETRVLSVIGGARVAGRTIRALGTLRQT